VERGLNGDGTSFAIAGQVQEDAVGGKRRILVVDDDEALLFAFKRIFRHSEVLIDTADTVDTAVELIDRYEYEIVITDLRFREVCPRGGYDVIRYVQEKRPLTKTVLWTAFGKDEAEVQHDECKPDFYLKKPVPSERIRTLIERIGNG
jgi:DNA-binding NtrC family response regulator